MNTSALWVKGDDFKDPLTDNPFLIGITTRKWGQYEVVTTLEDDAGQIAHISGTYENRDSQTLPGIWNLWSNKFTLTNPGDLNKLLRSDVVSSIWLPTNTEVQRISPDGLELFLSNDFTTTSNTIQLASDEIEGLVLAVDGVSPVISSSSTMVAYNVVNIPVPVYGNAKNSFVTIWRTDTGGETIHFPLDATGTYDFTIDWWDGNTETFGPTDGNTLNHTYATAGTYTIVVDGILNWWSFRSLNPQISAGKLLEVKQWWDVQLWSFGLQFKGAENVVFTAQDQIDTSNVTLMNEAFENATNFNSDIGYWDTSNVTRMSFMFRNNSAFNQDIWDWDTSNVERMEFMFRNNPAFNQDIWDWDTDEVTNMSFMFDNAAAFNQGIWDWDTGEVTNMSGMFRDASSFNQDLNLWDTIKVLDMSFMFVRADNFNGNIWGWGVDSVTNMSYMFRFANWFNQDISGWNTWSVQQMEFMFRDTASFDQDIWDWDVDAVSNYAEFDTNSNTSWSVDEKPGF